MTRKIIISSLVVSMGLLLGRLMGFVREATIASTFGVSAEADVAVLALTIPDVLVSMLIAGGLSAALIPELKKLSRADAGLLFVQASTAMAIASSIFVCLLSLIPSVLVGLFAPGMSQETSLVAQSVLMGVLWLIPLTVLAGVSTAYLQAQEKFLMPALGTLIFNTSVVFGLIVFVDEPKDLHVLVYFILCGGLLRWGSQSWMLFDQAMWRNAFLKLLLHKYLFHRYWQAVLALGFLALFPVVARSFASLAGEGSLAMMNYAWRLVEFPLGLVVTILSVVLFPKLAAMVADKEDKEFTKTFNDGLLLSLVLAMIISGCVLGSPEIFVRMAFGWGEHISDEEIMTISYLLQVGIVALPVQAAIAMSVAVFNARNETYIPAWVSFYGFSILIALSWYIEPIFGLFGIVVVAVVSYCLVASLLLFFLRKKRIDLNYTNVIYAIIIGLLSYIMSQVVSFFHASIVVNFLFLLASMLISLMVVFLVNKKMRFLSWL